MFNGVLGILVQQSWEMGETEVTLSHGQGRNRGRRRLITSNPFREVEMLEERKERRQPHILTFEEERLLKVAPDAIRILAILIPDPGLRSGRGSPRAQMGEC